MKKIYSSVDFTIVRISKKDIIATSPNGFLMKGTQAEEGDYTTDGTNTADYVW